MKAILIDPYATTIRKIRCNGDYRQISRLIECTLFDTVLLPNGDAIYVDSERLLTPIAERRFWAIPQFYPGEFFPGRGLLLGSDSIGNSIAPQTSVEKFKVLVKFLREAPLQETPPDGSLATRVISVARMRAKLSR
ncbi:MAG TPA: hypothetical protein VJU59_23300 [Paraburkholderia sp.]|uniref:hypothetical protein n=1 Tax=Paraburkholderia sp. TaxID=1926495 RepID=UPI002B48F909|nr:hypothetical protein [Paraburkholderia sp.]HKR42561.1 hypothetical protein [Paraburkholderia sp.]